MDRSVATMDKTFGYIELEVTMMNEEYKLLPANELLPDKSMDFNFAPLSEEEDKNGMSASTKTKPCHTVPCSFLMQGECLFVVPCHKKGTHYSSFSVACLRG